VLHASHCIERIRSRNTVLYRFSTLWSCIIHYKILVYKTHTVLETLLYRVFGTSSDDTHASIFRIAMAVWTFPAVVWLVGWSAKHFGESWSGCNGIWCSASNMLPPPEKCQPTNTLTKRDFMSFPNTLKLYYTLQNTCIQDTHSARNTLISSVWDVLRRYTCVHFLNSYDSLNISDSSLTRRVICQTFWGKLVGLQWDLVQR